MHALIDRRNAATRGAVAVDLGLYAGCTAFAAFTAVGSEFYGFRIWGWFATAAYGFALLHATWLLLSGTRANRGSGPLARLRSRWTPIAVIGIVGMLAPLAVLVVRRLTGRDWLNTPGSWSAQPEVWVIERAAKLLFTTGTPYTDIAALGRAAVVNDYTPYGPAMALFGLPRALFGDSPLTDARLVFALTAVLTVVGALRLLGWPHRAFAIPVRAAQLAVIFPLTAYTWAVAGPDLAIVGLIVLGIALAARDHAGWAALVLAIVLSAKLTALPAVVVVAVLVAARLGARGLGRFGAVHLLACAVLNIPVLLVAPRAYLDHVFLFPAGLAEVVSPAASPLPGHLLASAGSIGRVLGYVVLALAALAIAAWLLRRPPRTAADTALRCAIALATATLLVPATRFGYLVYPTVLLGAALCFSVAERTARPEDHTGDDHPVPVDRP
ncbi:uncharacterized protein DUF2029 [Tamaricihabitans halophyticus]|uniref:Uncharacterized protein DUF2029 n=1 Tax=Tamaricihabitans halophyticus TaxID=1262583 RepID=A0A4V2SU85_9PSEU|nr:uncharacterized protein DUF2029 [Tamaricihabitans halophyticus]